MSDRAKQLIGWTLALAATLAVLWLNDEANRKAGGHYDAKGDWHPYYAR